MESIMPPSKPTVGIVIDEENESVYGTEYEAYTHWAVCAATTMTGRDLLASVERYKTQVVEDSTYKEPLTRDALSRAIIATVKKNEKFKNDTKMENSLHLTLIQTRHWSYLIEQYNNL